MKNTEYIQVSTTTERKAEAQRMASLLVDRKLAACAQIIGPITSTYRWQGKIRRSKEWLCLLKTPPRHYQAVEKVIKQNHSYELPEIIAVSIVEGNREYFRWVEKELQ